MKALILAGGLGTRLRAVVNDRPKPMADVNGKPFLQILIEQLSSRGINEIVLSVGYMADRIVSYFKDGDFLGVKIEYAKEEKPLGTGGAIKNAYPFLKNEDRFLVINGDTYLDADFSSTFIRSSELNAIAYLLVKKGETRQKAGLIELDENNRVISIREVEKASGYFYAGASVLRRDVFEHMPAAESFSFEYDLLPRLLSYGVYAQIFEGYLRDIGTAESYRAFLDEVKTVARKV